MEETIKIELNRRELIDNFNSQLHGVINKKITENIGDIEKSIEQYFKKAFFNDKATAFDNALDYTIEISFREGIELAMKEMNFKEIIAQKAKELLSDSNLIHELAEAKVRSSLGLPRKETTL